MAGAVESVAYSRVDQEQKGWGDLSFTQQCQQGRSEACLQRKSLLHLKLRIHREFQCLARQFGI